jgi:CheY-like chemotaxis protein
MLVYVVDDHDGIREVMREMLEARAYEVVTFGDGAAALDAVKARAPALVLLDINMPGMTGWRVREALRDDPATASIPVIAVTAQGGAAIETSAIVTLKFDGFLRKPFRVKDLISKVEKVLAARAA